MATKKKPSVARERLKEALQKRGDRDIAEVARELGVPYHVAYRVAKQGRKKAPAALVATREVASAPPAAAPASGSVHELRRELLRESTHQSLSLLRENQRLRELLRVALEDLDITIGQGRWRVAAAAAE